MNDLSAELLRAGLITQKQHDRQRPQEERREKKAERKSQGRTGFHSLRDFLEDACRRLSGGYSRNLMKQIVREAHGVADSLSLTDRRRKRMHAFLARVEEGLQSRTIEEREEFLADAFQEIDPGMISDD